MRRILLINPDTDSTVDAFKEFFAPMLSFHDKRAYLAPVPLATLAALTPDEWEIDIWDEPVHGLIHEASNLKDYALVGVTGLMSQIRGARRVGEFFRRNGVLTVAGGPGVSGTPEFFRDAFDVLFVGEAETLWAPFLADVKAGTWRKEYRQITKPDLNLTPLPRWDSVAKDMKYYLAGGVQTTRGCPFSCEFCQVSFLNGRIIRTKPIDRVIAEVCEMERLGLKHIMFCDDNFIANPAYTKALLKELVPVNKGFETPLSYSTELSLNLAKDEELLELFAAVNFGTVCIGLETPNVESLKETNKPQNYKTNIIEDVHRILSYGIGVRAGFIVGFDHDEADIFERQWKFIQETCIHGPVVNMVKAVPGTRFWSRLQNERRLVEEERLIQTNQVEGCKITSEYLFAHTNIIPTHMTRVEMMKGYRGLLARVHDWDSFAQRMMGYLQVIRAGGHIRVPAAVPDPARTARRERLAFGFFRLLKRLGPKARRLIFRALPMRGGADGLAAAETRRLALQFMELIVNLEPKAQQAVIRVVMATRNRAPRMMGTILRFILYHLSASKILKPMLASLDAQIAHEETVSLDAFVDRKAADIFPAGFREEYGRVFPKLYQHCLETVEDHRRIPELLVRLFVDYLQQCASEPFVAIDQDFLFRIAARAASEGPALVLAEEDRAVFASNRKMNELRYEVLNFVERDLRAFYYASPETVAVES